MIHWQCLLSRYYPVIDLDPVCLRACLQLKAADRALETGTREGSKKACMENTIVCQHKED